MFTGFSFEFAEVHGDGYHKLIQIPFKETPQISGIIHEKCFIGELTYSDGAKIFGNIPNSMSEIKKDKYEFTYIKDTVMVYVCSQKNILVYRDENLCIIGKLWILNWSGDPVKLRTEKDSYCLGTEIFIIPAGIVIHENKKLIAKVDNKSIEFGSKLMLKNGIPKNTIDDWLSTMYLVSIDDTMIKLPDIGKIYANALSKSGFSFADEKQPVMKCTVCYDKSFNSVVMPCKHSGFCSGCLNKISVCPTCRGPISERLKIYV